VSRGREDLDWPDNTCVVQSPLSCPTAPHTPSTWRRCVQLVRGAGDQMHGPTAAEPPVPQWRGQRGTGVDGDKGDRTRGAPDWVVCERGRVKHIPHQRLREVTEERRPFSTSPKGAGTRHRSASCAGGILPHSGVIGEGEVAARRLANGRRDESQDVPTAPRTRCTMGIASAMARHGPQDKVHTTQRGSNGVEARPRGQSGRRPTGRRDEEKR
jgi:hypothetical protein